ncbi:MAG: tRNA adenosine(34) deaminase TadA [Bdellovibrionia bacterium]
MSASQNPESQHLYWMNKVLKLATKAGARGEVPVAAVVVGPEGLIASAINQRETLQTPLGHAEILALHRAAKKRNNWRLEDCTLYVNLEPCLMCAGAISQARVGTVVYGAADPKGGAVESLYQTLTDQRLNHRCEIHSGICAHESSQLLTDFFQNKRSQKKQAETHKQVRKRAEALVLKDNHILVVHLQDPEDGRHIYTLPGGGVDEGEAPIETAQREAFEETGYRIEIVPDLSVSKEFDFMWKGTLVSCHTTYFLARLLNPESSPTVVKDAEYNKGFEWMPISKVLDLWTPYPKAKAAVEKLLKKRHLLNKP